MQQDEEEEEMEACQSGHVSKTDKAKVKELRANLGHPRQEDFVRALKMSRAREEI